MSYFEFGISYSFHKMFYFWNNMFVKIQDGSHMVILNTNKEAYICFYSTSEEITIFAFLMSKAMTSLTCSTLCHSNTNEVMHKIKYYYQN